MGSLALCLGRKKHRAVGELCVCVWQHPEHPESPMGVPRLLLPICLGRKPVHSPELISRSLVGMGTVGLEISVGGAAATIASRATPGIAQRFLLPINWRHGPERMWEVFTKWPVPITDGWVCASQGLQFEQFVSAYCIFHSHSSPFFPAGGGSLFNSKACSFSGKRDFGARLPTQIAQCESQLYHLL